jgi:succinate-semialdehyde dehydrogenase/glutarate-semialdehyde dehydrogenase
MENSIASINPVNEQVLRYFNPDTAEELERKIARAAETFREYRRTTMNQRADWLRRAGDILEPEKARLGRLMTVEMGKPIRAAVQEVEKCALACRYYVENAARCLADESIATNARSSYVRYEPLGPVLAVMPWNFPFWQVFRFATPALMVGNVGLLKHASNVPQCALAIEEIFRRAGFPEGAFQALLIGPERVGPLLTDARISAATLTGSLGAGSSVGSAAGKAIKKTVLELGGSDPFIVMPSANLERAVATAVQARTINNGQSCIAAKRFIVDRRIAEEFERRFTARMAALIIGDPLDENTQIGPLATAGVLATLEGQVNETVRLGAQLKLGGKRLPRVGYFYPPTVLTNIPPGSPAHNDELFGPVASLFQAEGMEDAIRIANDSPFGLGACAWTNDEGERELFINEIQAGAAFLNGLVASDPRLPFGGIKQSGYGRELSYHGLREFVNIKTVVKMD